SSTVASTAPAPAVESAPDVRSFTRVAEITRKLYHQGTAKAVLTTAVKEIGTHWEATRCIAAMGQPGLPPTSLEEYHAEGLKKGSLAALGEMVACLQPAATGGEPVIIPDVQKSPQA